MRKGNFGSMLIDSVLPEQMRGKARTLDAKGLSALFKEVHEVAPEKYPVVLKHLADIGRRVSTESGGFSFGPEDLIEPEHITKLKDVVRQKVHHEILRNRQDSALGILRELSGTLPKDLYAHQLSIGSPMAKQIASGSRGNPGAMARLMSGDVLYVDHRDREVPYPILRGFAEGLDSAEYFGASFGGRKGVVDTKLSVQNSGALAKVLKQAVHKLLVTKQQDDFEENPDRPRGLPVDTEDNESDGAFLAQPVAGFPRNTVINSKVRAAIKAKGFDRILVRSPISGRIAPGGGLYARDVGIRESGDLPGIGDAVGITASDTISEPVGQGTLSSKHAGGAAGSVRKVGGFKALQQIIGVPKTFPGGAAHSETDGNVDSITDHPDGGKVVSISGTEHYVAPGFAINVKPGDTVEAGDPISDGLPNPSKIAEHQGLGEAKRKMVGYLKNTLSDLNISAERRNLELVAHGLVNHVTVDDELGPYYPGDTVPYDEIEKHWEPRDTARTSDVDDAAGQYLEQPVLHYTVGTKIRPSVRKELKAFGVKNIQVHPEPPPFHASMIRAQDSLRHDPDWMTRFLGTNLEDSLLDSTHRGLSSSPASTSFVPAAASGQIENFGPIAGKGILKSKPGSVLGGIGKAADALREPSLFPRIGASPSTKTTPSAEPTPSPAPVVKPIVPCPTPSRGSVLAGIRKSASDEEYYEVNVGGRTLRFKGPRPQYHHCSKCREPHHGPRSLGTVPVYDIDPSECHYCGKEEKKGAGLTAAGGTGGPVAAGPLTTKPNSILPPPVPKPKPLATEPKPVQQPKAVSGITEGNSAEKPLPGLASNPFVGRPTDTGGAVAENPVYKPYDNMQEGFNSLRQGKIPLNQNAPKAIEPVFRPPDPVGRFNALQKGEVQNTTGGAIAAPAAAGGQPPPPPAHTVSPLTSAAVSALGRPVAQYGGLAGLAALTDFTGHNGSNIQTLFGDRAPNPDAHLFERALPAHLRNAVEPIMAQPQPAAPPPAAAAPAPAAPAAPAPAAPPPPPQAGASGLIAGTVAGNTPQVQKRIGDVAAKAAPKAVPNNWARGAGAAGAMAVLPVLGDSIQQLIETKRLDPKRLAQVAGQSLTDAGMYAGTNAILSKAIPGGPGFVPTQVVTSTVKDLADSAGILHEWAGGSKDDATRIQNARDVQESTGETMFGKAFRGENYSLKDLGKAWGSAALNSLNPKFISNTQAAIKAHQEYEQRNKETINTNMRAGPMVGASARSGIAKAQAAGDPKLEMRNRLAAAETDARLAQSNMMASAPLWSTGGPKGNLWSQLGDQMADLAKARVMVEHGLKEDGSPMSQIEKIQMQEAIKQRSAMVQKNQDLLNRGFWGDAFAG